MQGHGGEKYRLRARELLETARLLQASSKDFRSVYYNSGHAIEIIMIAIGLKSRSLLDSPPNEKGAAWHDLTKLARSLGILSPLTTATQADRLLMDAWLVVRDWKSNDRFPGASMTRKEGLDMHNACVRLMEWLQNRYEQI